ncbi:hypothetical protein M408DRAFT_20814 [Serendipita vermifera MAFF 305830]|uniref:Fungal-type protein kinase domain-containing protein n=1 Tax=Serendipita vermifera MAFF 305830 TaxID=933852 RepID=A0A0C3BJA1_SERVB|nr:hypothetical protein M408DRAFT_20814 [Serendipita vermifera MAFF 305830]
MPSQEICQPGDASTVGLTHFDVNSLLTNKERKRCLHDEFVDSSGVFMCKMCLHDNFVNSANAFTNDESGAFTADMSTLWVHSWRTERCGAIGNDDSGSGDVENQKNHYMLDIDKFEERELTDSSIAISTSLHRAQLNLRIEEDSVAHRLVLESKGKRLNEYEDLLSLLKAVLACVKGHETLYANGILHRDISIGNVFISNPDQSDPSTTLGFLADLDMAKVHDEEKLAGMIGKKSAKLLVKSTTGSIAGTTQFMSLSLLYQYAHPERKRKAKEPIMKKPSLLVRRNPKLSQRPRLPTDSPLHDLESFVWVLFYALCLKEMNSKPSLSERAEYYAEYFVDLFGALSFREILEGHSLVMDQIIDTNSPGDSWKLDYISDSDAWLVLEELMQAASAGTLDYKEFKETLQHYIGQLEQPKPANT